MTYSGKAVLRYGEEEQIVDVTYKESKTPAPQDGHAASFRPVGEVLLRLDREFRES